MTFASDSRRTGRNPLTRWVAARRSGGTGSPAGVGGAENSSQAFTVSVHDDATNAVIEVAGELDIYTAPALRHALLDLVAAGRFRIVVDLRDVVFLDSSALGVLVGGYKRASTMGGHLRVVCPAGPLAEVFRVTGLDRVLPLYASVRDAVDNDAHTPSTFVELATTTAFLRHPPEQC